MDNIAATKDDFSLNENVFRFDGRDFSSVPISFTYNGTDFRGIPESFSPAVTEIRADLGAGKKTTVISGRSEDGLEVVAHFNEYENFPVCEWLFFFSNAGQVKHKPFGGEEIQLSAIDADAAENTGILENIKVGDRVIKGTNPVLYHGNGDTCTDEGYEMTKDPVDRELVYAPLFGVTSSPDDMRSADVFSFAGPEVSAFVRKSLAFIRAQGYSTYFLNGVKGSAPHPNARLQKILPEAARSPAANVMFCSPTTVLRLYLPRIAATLMPLESAKMQMGVRLLRRVRGDGMGLMSWREGHDDKFLVRVSRDELWGTSALWSMLFE